MLCLWGLRGERKKKEEEDCIYHRNFCDGSRTMSFFFSFSVVGIARNADFMGIEED